MRTEDLSSLSDCFLSNELMVNLRKAKLSVYFLAHTKKLQSLQYKNQMFNLSVMTSNDKSFKIFASPLDSYFDVSELHITPELLEDNLKTLAEENQAKASKVSENDGYFKEGKATGL